MDPQNGTGGMVFTAMVAAAQETEHGGLHDVSTPRQSELNENIGAYVHSDGAKHDGSRNDEVGDGAVASSVWSIGEAPDDEAHNAIGSDAASLPYAMDLSAVKQDVLHHVGDQAGFFLAVEPDVVGDDSDMQSQEGVVARLFQAGKVLIMNTADSIQAVTLALTQLHEPASGGDHVKLSGQQLEEAANDVSRIPDAVSVDYEVALDDTSEGVADDGAGESGDAEEVSVSEENSELADRDLSQTEAGNLGLEFSVSTAEELDQLLSEYMEETMSRFVVAKKTKNFGKSDKEVAAAFKEKPADQRRGWRIFLAAESKTTKKPRPDFSESDDRVPHIVYAHKTYECHMGMLSSYKRDRWKRSAIRDEETGEMKRQRKTVPTKKCGCPVKIYVKQIIRFPQFAIDQDTEYKRKMGSTRLRKAMEAGEDMKVEVKFIGRLPHVSEHKFHDLVDDTVSKEPVHHELISQIEAMTFRGMNSGEIKKALEEFVAKDMFENEEPPARKRRRYYPSVVDIRNYMRRAQEMLRISKQEEVSIEQLVARIREQQPHVNCAMELNETAGSWLERDGDNEDDFFDAEGDKQTSRTDKKAQTFFFCYQTPEQQRLLKRYGSLVFITQIAASMFSSKLPLLYCMLVRTNVDFQVVGVFIISQTVRGGLTKGLDTIKTWNPTWLPRHVMVDYKKEDLQEVESAFQGASVFITPHSCEEAWLQFLHKPINGVIEFKDEVIGHLRAMAYSYSEDSLTLAAALLEGSTAWQQNSRFRYWFQTNWLHCAKQWVAGYRPDDLILCDESKSCLPEAVKAFKEAHSYSIRHKALSRLIEKIVFKILPDSYENYVHLNGELYSASRSLAEKHGEDMYSVEGLPQLLLPSVLDKIKAVRSSVFHIASTQVGVFQVEVDKAAEPKGSEGAALQVGALDITSDRKTLSSGSVESDRASLLVQLSGLAATSLKTASDLTDPVADSSATKEVLASANQSEEGGNLYTVSFGDGSSMPFCTCCDWQRNKKPCLHMCAVFCNVPGWGWDMLAPVYRASSLWVVDNWCLQLFAQSRRREREKEARLVHVEVQTDLSSSECVDELLDFSDGATQGRRIIRSVEELKWEPRLLLRQCRDLLLHIDKLSFLFCKQTLYRKMKLELTELVAALEQVKPHGKRKFPAGSESVDASPPQKVCIDPSDSPIAVLPSAKCVVLPVDATGKPPMGVGTGTPTGAEAIVPWTSLPAALQKAIKEKISGSMGASFVDQPLKEADSVAVSRVIEEERQTRSSDHGRPADCGLDGADVAPTGQELSSHGVTPKGNKLLISTPGTLVVTANGQGSALHKGNVYSKYRLPRKTPSPSLAGVAGVSGSHGVPPASTSSLSDVSKLTCVEDAAGVPFASGCASAGMPNNAMASSSNAKMEQGSVPFIKSPSVKVYPLRAAKNTKPSKAAR